MPKKNDHSIGVAPQYASSLGKTANCQLLVSLTLASGEIPVIVRRRLFVPESSTDDQERMACDDVPEDRRTALVKPENEIEEIDRIVASGARFGFVLSDSGYVSSAPFRQGASVRKVERLCRRPSMPDWRNESSLSALDRAHRRTTRHCMLNGDAVPAGEKLVNPLKPHAEHPTVLRDLARRFCFHSAAVSGLRKTCADAEA